MENTDTTEYKIVYYKNGEFTIDKCIGQVWINDDSEYKKYHIRVYPADYNPTLEQGYGSENLIDSW